MHGFKERKREKAIRFRSLYQIVCLPDTFCSYKNYNSVCNNYSYLKKYAAKTNKQKRAKLCINLDFMRLAVCIRAMLIFVLIIKIWI